MPNQKKSPPGNETCAEEGWKTIMKELENQNKRQLQLFASQNKKIELHFANQMEEPKRSEDRLKELMEMRLNKMDE